MTAEGLVRGGLTMQGPLYTQNITYCKYGPTIREIWNFMFRGKNYCPVECRLSEQNISSHVTGFRPMRRSINHVTYNKIKIKILYGNVCDFSTYIL